MVLWLCRFIGWFGSLAGVYNISYTYHIFSGGAGVSILVSGVGGASTVMPSACDMFRAFFPGEKMTSMYHSSDAGILMLFARGRRPHSIRFPVILANDELGQVAVCQSVSEVKEFCGVWGVGCPVVVPCVRKPIKHSSEVPLCVC